MIIKKVFAAVLLTGILGLGSGLMLSGCSGVNSSLQNDHIMNGGCFITCYNKANKKGSGFNKTDGIKHYNSVPKTIGG